MKTVLLDVIDLCHTIDEISAVFYDHFSRDAENTTEKEFWDAMSASQKDQMCGWAELHTMAKIGIVPQILDKPFDALQELTSLMASSTRYFKAYQHAPNTVSAFVVAGNLELQMINDYALKLVAYYNKYLVEEKPWEYDAHLEMFLTGMELIGDGNPELELLGTTIRRLYRETTGLVERSAVDTLTGLANRAGFRSGLEAMLNLAGRANSRVAVMLVGITGLQELNKAHGPHLGDLVLKATANEISKEIRQSDVAGRFCGVEFAVCLNDVTVSALPTIAKNLRHRVRKLPEAEGKVDVAIGVAHGKTNNEIGTVASELLSRAGWSLQRARRVGAHPIVIHH